ncbi:MAG: glycosyltransferase [Actinomycetota bacterium]
MRQRRLLLVAGGATAVDLGGFLLLAAGLGVLPPVADAVALLAATPISFLLHRLPGGGRPYQRWVEHPGRFVAVAGVAGVVDVAVVALLAGGRDESFLALLAAKLVALAVAALVRLAGFRRLLFRTVRAEQGVADPDRPPPPGDGRCTVILPAYRDEGRIGAAVVAVRDAFADADADADAGRGGVEIVVVDDGSGDGTAEEATAAGADTVVVQPENRGKGAAIRAGVEVASGGVVAFTDSDLAYSPDHLVVLRDRIEEGWDVVVGSRRHTEAIALVRAGRLRELGGRAINLLTQVVLLGRYVDTQCGLKAFRSDVARSLFSRARIDGFAFDVELFHLIERDRLSLLEIPVRIANSERSSVRVVRDATRLVVDLFRIRHWAALGLYAPDDRSAGSRPR